MDDGSVPLPTLGAAAPRALPAGLSSITEGGAQVLFTTGEVFYNPVQILNRDLSVMALRAWDALRSEAATPKARLRAFQAHGLSTAQAEAAMAASPSAMPPLRIMEALSASGLRSLRYAAELPPGRVGLIVANDLEPAAAEAIRRNVAFNAQGAPPSATVVVPNAGDASLVMRLAAAGLPALPGMAAWMPPAPSADSGGSPRPFLFDSVDLDPYGSAAPFLDAALAAIADGGLLAITCTDMAVLAGNHIDACRTKYGAFPVKGRHFGEQALRILLAAVEQAANRQRKAITPVASLCVDFYVRVFVTVHASPSRAASAPLRLGNIHQCTGCDSFWLWPLGRDKAGSGSSKGLLWQAGPEAAGGAAAEGAEGSSSSSASSSSSSSSSSASASGSRKRVRGEGMEVEDAEAEDSSPAAAAAAAAAPPSKQQQQQQQQHTFPNTAPDLPCQCPHCGRGIVVGGPLWLPPIHDPAFLRRLRDEALTAFGDDGRGGGQGGNPLYHLAAQAAPRAAGDGGSNGCATAAVSRRRLLGVLHSLVEELPSAPLYYEVSTLCSRLKASPPPLADFFSALRNAGYRASGSHASPGVVKTDAPPAVVWAVVRMALAQGKGGEGGEAAAAAAVGAGAAGADSGSSSSKGQTVRAAKAAAAAAAAAEREAARALGAGAAAHASSVPAAVASLASMPVHLALASAHSCRPTLAELPCGEQGLSFAWSPAMQAAMAERKAERDKGGGQRFMPNPGANWGPKARATGDKGKGEAQGSAGAV